MYSIKYLMLEPTNQCSLNCIYCNRRDVVRKEKHISLTDWCTILNKLSNEPIHTVKLQNLGETYLHPKADTLVYMVRKTFPEAYLISATNCQYSDKAFDRLVESLPYINLLYLSIDGYEKTYEKYRRGASWSRLINFLDKMKEIDIPKSCRVTINYVVDGNNYSDIHKLHQLVDESYPFIEQIRLNVAQWWGEDAELNLILNDDFYEYMSRYKEDVMGITPWNWSDCWWPKEGFICDVNGDVRICLLNTNTHPTGNILTQPLDELKMSIKRIIVAGRCINNTPGIHCRQCDYKRLSPILGRIKNG